MAIRSKSAAPKAVEPDPEPEEPTPVAPTEEPDPNAVPEGPHVHDVSHAPTPPAGRVQYAKCAGCPDMVEVTGPPLPLEG